ncbi:D-lactate dehydrogenase [Mannheimia haemolytica]|uniref:D-lactate dehydrogenase n=1 Tax=Mannheimia haemolytica TaxID=75985 RepID=A0A378N8T7_MANHA|nr:D-lactate dehydrogenase [Mannheimia haemolytica]
MSNNSLISQLTEIVGQSYIITDPTKTEAYRSGYRFGTGSAIAVVKPTTLLEYWNVLKSLCRRRCHCYLTSGQYRINRWFNTKRQRL